MQMLLGVVTSSPANKCSQSHLLCVGCCSFLNSFNTIQHKQVEYKVYRQISPGAARGCLPVSNTRTPTHLQVGVGGIACAVLVAAAHCTECSSRVSRLEGMHVAHVMQQLTLTELAANTASTCPAYCSPVFSPLHLAEPCHPP